MKKPSRHYANITNNQNVGLCSLHKVILTKRFVMLQYTTSTHYGHTKIHKKGKSKSKKMELAVKYSKVIRA